MVTEKERAIGGGGETRHWQFLGNLPLDKEKFMAACREGGERIAAVLRIMDRDMGPALYRTRVASP